MDGFFNGYNATVLAYGQTGAGKTFTMGSGNNAGFAPQCFDFHPSLAESIPRIEPFDAARWQANSRRKLG